MFLVEPKSGERCHYRSAQALGVAIRRGELGAEARIFHSATNRWLSITVHPEYRQAELERQERSARWMDQRQWTFLAERPDATGDALFAPIPPGKPAGRLVLLPGATSHSWLGLAFRRVLRMARAGV
jgi:hypothetical protein